MIGLLSFLENVIFARKGPPRNKHSSILCPKVSDKEKKFNKIDFRPQLKTFGLSGSTIDI
jgi:hypothetical protein